jgi:arylsulfatase A-like enzyme
MRRLLLVCLLLGCRTGGAEEQRADPRPNILFVLTDDQSVRSVSAYGSGLNATPHIDRLANEGVLFRNSFVGNSICGPARATLLTGLHSHAHGVMDNRTVFDGSQRTFPKLLQAAGYQTAIVGKWHLSGDPTGFDHWEVLIRQGNYYNPTLRTRAGTTRHEGYTTEVITDRALAWLEHERDPERPFLLLLHHKAPHRLWAPGPGYFELFDDERIPEPPTLFDDGSGRASGAATQELTIAQHLEGRDLKLAPPRGLTPAQLELWDAAYAEENRAYETADLDARADLAWRYQRFVKDYLRCVAAVDDQIGRVLDWLDDARLADDTLVVFTSDQGFFLGEHGWYDKRWMYEESLRTPLIVRGPGVARGAVDEHLVQNVDLAPTLLDLAGVRVPDDLHGASLVPLLRGSDPPDWRASIYYQYVEHPGVGNVPRQRGVRTARHKLIHYYQLDEWELFDLEADPREISNIYGRPAYMELTGELRAELERLRELYAVDVE